MNEESMANLSIEALKKHRTDCLNQRLTLSDAAEEAASPLGRRAASRWKKERDAVREQYAGIKVRDVPPERVSFELHYLQVRERFLTEEILRLESAKKMLELIDAELIMCDAGIKSKEESARTAR